MQAIGIPEDGIDILADNVYGFAQGLDIGLLYAPWQHRGNPEIDKAMTDSSLIQFAAY